MNEFRYLTVCCVTVLLVSCGKEEPPVSPVEFMEKPRLLEATMVRCAQNRAESRYVAECVNAREAVNRLEAAAERKRREGLEQQSERKRQALRRTQAAAAEARRLAEENQKRREEQEYLDLFDQVPDADNPAGAPQQGQDSLGEHVAPALDVESLPTPTDESTHETVDDIAAPETDLGAIREELKRRQETGE